MHLMIKLFSMLNSSLIRYFKAFLEYPLKNFVRADQNAMFEYPLLSRAVVESSTTDERLSHSFKMCKEVK